MQAGDIILVQQKGRKSRFAYCTSGSFYSNGRISNHWSWRYFGSNGQLTTRRCSGHNNGSPYTLSVVTGYKLVIKMVPSGARPCTLNLGSSIVHHDVWIFNQLFG